MEELEAEIAVTEQLLTHYQAARKRTTALYAPLEVEDYNSQPVYEASPPKWQLGHTTWFFENFVLVPNAPGYKVFDERFGFLFNSYYETVGQRLLRENRGNLTRPSVAAIYAYREYVDTAMAEYMAANVVSSELMQVIELGINHEQQHQELFLTDFKYILSQNPLLPAYKQAQAKPELQQREAGWLSVDEGTYEIGHNTDDFCFDNELGRHKVYLHPFRIQDRLITVGEYLQFVNAGNYTDFRPWLSDGWSWVQDNSIEAPLHWQKVDDVWHQFTLTGLHPLNLAEPVTHLSYYEADAYAAWRGMRLPTEFEWEVAAREHQPEIPECAHLQNGPNHHPTAAGSNNNQLFGDCWEWTSSAYLPYPYYAKAPGAIGEYNGKFMVNQMVLRGGSIATPPDHIRHTYRNFFHAHLRWQFTGIRLAESL